MPTLKDLRIRKKSVQSTKKITAAMKMIAAAKLKKAQEKAQSARPYANIMKQMLAEVLLNSRGDSDLPALISGHVQTYNDNELDHRSAKQKHLIVLLTSDRGLCGGFNTGLVKHARLLINDLTQRGHNITIVCIGRKGEEQLKREYKDLIVDVRQAQDLPQYHYADAIAQWLCERFDDKMFDVCTIIYNRFITALKNEVTLKPLIPCYETSSESTILTDNNKHSVTLVYEYEPSKKTVLTQLVRKNLSVQIFQALLETAASEHGARMTAMDSATRNAAEMIRKLELSYNRTRQAMITNELIEIISGAQAL